MRIGIFTDCYYPQINGVVTSIRMLEEELIKLGHEVTIITVQVPNHIDDNDRIIRVKSIPFSKWKEFRLGIPFYGETYRQIKSMNFDLIHTHTEFSIGLLGRFMAKSLDIPILHTYHTMYEDYSHYIYNLRYGKGVVKRLIMKGSKLYVKKYDGVIAPTDKTKLALQSYGVTNDIFVVPTGIDLNHFERYSKSHPKIVSIMEQYKVNENDRILLSLGRVSEEKSIDSVIQELPNVLSRIDNLKLMIVGDGPYRAKLEKLTQDLGLENHVIFTGRIPFEEVSYYYSLGSVFISASKTETQGLTIMEAMASSVPVIAYNDTNIKDVIIEGISGRLFRTSEELGSQIIDAFENPQKTQAMTLEAIKIVNHLSKESYAKNAETVYFQLIHTDFESYHKKINA